ncbi:beta strand repeat-containing protein [Sulfitobacter sp.]|uniref:beta strand repeat-containing protein n=1 Tax=Sulfitobacter sp. TaxID=1903071 RepID=UPI00300112ED
MVEVTSVTPSLTVINGDTTTFTVVVVFDQQMDPSVFPTLDFGLPLPSVISLTTPAPNWNSVDTVTITYEVTGMSGTFSVAGISVMGGQNTAVTPEVHGSTTVSLATSIDIDLDPPSQPTVNFAGAGDTTFNDAEAIQIAFSGIDADATGTITITSNGAGSTPVVLTGITNSSTNPMELTVGQKAMLGDGTLTVTLVVTDAAGNSAAAPAAQTFTLDTSADADATALSVGFANSGGDTTFNSTEAIQIAFAGIDADATGTITITSDGAGSTPVVLTGITSSSTNPLPLNAGQKADLADGTLTVTLVVTDAAGNSVAAPTAPTFELDTSADADGTTLSVGFTNSGADMTFSGSEAIQIAFFGIDADATGTITVVSDGIGSTDVVLTSPADFASSPVTLTAAQKLQLKDGNLTVTLVATDDAGNTAQVVSNGYDLDVTGPLVVSGDFTGESTDGQINLDDNTVTLTITFDEAMNPAVDPTVVLNGDAATNLTEDAMTARVWDAGNTTLAITYNVTGTTADHFNITFSVTGGQDAAGNTLTTAAAVATSTGIDTIASVSETNAVTLAEVPDQEAATAGAIVLDSLLGDDGTTYALSGTGGVYDAVSIVANADDFDLVISDTQAAREFFDFEARGGVTDGNGTITTPVSIDVDVIGTDNGGNATTSTITLTLTNLNDAPILGAGTNTLGATATERADGLVGENDTPFGTSGTYTVSDDDLTDIHSINVANNGTGYLGVLIAGFDDPITGDGQGIVGWDFTIGFPLPAGSQATQMAVIDALGATETIVQTYDVTISDGQGGSLLETITVTIQGTNDQPVISATSSSASVTEVVDDASDQQLETQGTLSVADTDFSDDVTVTVFGVEIDGSSNFVGTAPTALADMMQVVAGDGTGTYGSATALLDADGTGSDFTWRFQAGDATTSPFDFLRAGETLVLNYTLRADDSSGTSDATADHIVTITVTGTNDVPVIIADSTAAVTAVEAGGTANGTAGTNQVTGDLSASANWTDSDATEAAALAVVEASHGATAQETLEFDKTGEAEVTGTYGSLFVNADGTYRYALDDSNAATQALDSASNVTETFNYTIANNGGGTGNTATNTLTINVDGANDAPVISVAGDNDLGTVTESGVDAMNAADAGTPSATGTLTATDVDASDTALTFSANAQGLQSNNGTTEITGTYGTFTISAAGVWTFALANGSAAVDALHEGQSVSETFEVQVSDDESAFDIQLVTLTIVGTNDAPVVTVDAGVMPDNNVTEVGAAEMGDVTASGAFSVTDIDVDAPTAADDAKLWSITEINGAAVQMPVVANGTPSTAEGTYGSLSLTNAGTWIYTLANTDTDTQALAENAMVTDVFTVRVADGLGGYDELPVTVTVTGSNDAPVISVETGNSDAKSVAESDAQNLTTTGTLTISDVDASDSVAVSVTSVMATGVLGTTYTSNAQALENMLTITDGSTLVTGSGNATGTSTWTFDSGTETFDFLANGESIALAYTVQAADGDETVSQTVTVTVTGTNDRPEIGAGAIGSTVTESTGLVGGNLVASGALAIVDADLSDEHAVSATRTSITWTDVNGADNLGTASEVTTPLPDGLEAALDAFTAVIDGTDDRQINWSFSLDDALADFLGEGETLTVVYDLNVDDQNSFDGMGADEASVSAVQQVTITIIGTNDTPVILAETENAFSEGDSLVLVDDQIVLVGGVPEVVTPAIVTVNLLGDGPETTDTINVTDVTEKDASDTRAITSTAISASGEMLGGMAVAGTIPAGFSATDVAAAFDLTTVAGVVTFDRNAAVFDALDDTEFLNIVISYEVTTTSPDGSTQSVDLTSTIRINGANDAPYILDGGDLARTITEFTDADIGVENTARPTETGLITFNDVDPGDISNLSVTTVAVQGGGVDAALLADYAGTFSAGFFAPTGTAEADAGVVFYQFDISDGLLDHLAEGEVFTQEYLISISDGTTTTARPIVLTFVGTNDAPTITAAVATDAEGAVTEDGTLITSGTLTLADVDVSDIVSLAVTGGGLVTNDGTAVDTSSMLTMAAGDGLDGLQASDTVTWTFNAGGELFDFLKVGEELELTYTITASDDTMPTPATATQDVVITITGTNDMAMISGDATGTVTEDMDAVTAGGTLTAVDADDGESLFIAHAGTAGDAGYGTFTLTAAGVWTYTLDSTNAPVQALGVDDTLTDTITVSSLDGTALQVLTVTIDGANDAPTITAAVATDAEGAVTEDGTLITSGTLTLADVDVSDIVSLAVTGGGLVTNDGTAVDTSSMLTMAAGDGLDGLQASDTVTWTFNAGGELFDFLKVGEELELTYTITASDDTMPTPATATQDVVITITGTNDVPVLADVTTTPAVVDTIGNDTILGDVSGTLVGTDADDDSVLSYTIDGETLAMGTTSLLGKYGTLTLQETGGYNYVVDTAKVQALEANEDPQETFTVVVFDGMATNTATLTVDITPANDTPELADATGSILDTDAADTQATLNGAFVATDRDAGHAAAMEYTISGQMPVPEGDETSQTFYFDRSAGTVGTTAGTGLIELGTLTVNVDGNYDFEPNSAGIDMLRDGENPEIVATVRATDPQAGFDEASLTISVTGENDAPVVGATTPPTQNGVVYSEVKEQAEGPTEGVQVGASGTIAFTDADSTTLPSFGFIAAASGYTGTVSFSPSGGTVAAGTVGWSIVVPDADLNALSEGEALGSSPQIYDITISDNEGGVTTQRVEISLVGTNDAPVIGGAIGSDAGAVTEAAPEGVVNTSGTLTIADEDTSDTVTLTVTSATALTTGSYTGTSPLSDAALKSMLQVAAGAAATTGFADTVTVDADGAGSDITWAFTSGATGDSSFNFLGAGETLLVEYLLTADDMYNGMSNGSDTQTVTVTITGTNDVPVAVGISATVAEDISDTSVIATASATDSDQSDVHSYAITDDTSGLFEIDVTTGEISLLDGANLDAETSTSHTLEVTITDSQLASTTQSVTVTVTDVDDNLTIAAVDNDSANNAVDENAAGGSPVGLTALSTDADITSGAIAYSISGGDGASLFDIDSSTGVVTVKTGADINREMAASYDIEVTATPANGAASTASTFTININDVDEFDVAATGDGDQDANEISEDATAGSTVGVTATAFDGDATNNGVIFQLSNNAGGIFEINTTGVVSLAQTVGAPSPDFETAQSHTITVLATSIDGSTVTEDFTISVLDVDDTNPVILTVAAQTHSENGIDVVTLTATDVDTPVGDISFTIVGGADETAFTISTDGLNTLQFVNAPDFENEADADTNNIYEVIVQATDTAGNLSTQAISVTVTDVNEAPTDVVLTNQQTTIAENTSAPIGGLKVADIGVVDDAIGFNDITLTGADASLFSIAKGENGPELRFDGGPADFENPNDADMDGDYEVTVEVRDATVAGSSSVTASFVLNVTGVNEAPEIDEVASDVAVSGDEGTDITGTILAADVDAGAMLNYALAAGGAPSNGAVTFGVEGAYTYTPTGDFNGTDSFIVEVTDGLLTDTVTVNVIVDAVNDAPENGIAGAFSATEDTDLPLTGLSVADVDAASGTITMILSVDSGSIAATASGGVSVLDSGTSLVTLSGTLADLNTYLTASAPVFSPALNAVADVTLTISTSDGGNTGSGGALTDVDTVTITVAPVDDAPIAADDVASTDEDTATTIDVASLIGEVDGDTTTVIASVNPAHGTVSVSGTQITFTPTANYNGAASISYTVTDDTTGALFDDGTVTVTVDAVDDAPTAADTTASTDEDTATTIDVASLIGEVDGDTTTVTASVDPAQGTVTVSGTQITFTPTDDYNGAATISYTVMDDTTGMLSDDGTVSVSVAAVNDSTEIDTTAQVTSGHIEAVDAAAPIATAVAADVTLTDVDALDYDTGVFAAAVDGGDATDVLDLDTAGNVAISGTDVTVSGTSVGSIAGRGTAALSVTFSDSAQSAQVQAVITALTYVTTSDNPAASRNITLNLTDGDGLAAIEQTVAVNITASNDSPTPEDDSFGATEGAFASAINVRTLGTADSDPDNGDTFTVTNVADIADTLDPNGGSAVVSAAAAGVITTDWGAEITLQENGQLFYNLTSSTAKFNSLAATETAIDSFSYTVTDQAGLSTTATVSVTITGVNDAIVAVSDLIEATEDTAGTITGNILDNDTDVDTNDTREIVNITSSVSASAVITATGYQITTVDGVVITLGTDGAYTLTAPESLNGGQVYTANFQYSVQDGGSSTTTSVVVEVTGDNDVPTAAAVTLIASNEDTLRVITQAEIIALGVTDIDADASLEITSLTLTSGNGVLTDNNDGTWNYQPDLNDDGAVTFSYVASDGLLTATANASLDLLPVDDAPTAADTTASTDEDTATTIDVASLIGEVDGDTTTVTASVDPAQGTVTVLGTVITFTPTDNYNGAASISYTVTDDTTGALFDDGTVTVTVDAVDDAPTLDVSISSVTLTDTTGDDTFTTTTGVLTSSDPDTGDTVAFGLTGAITSTEGTFDLELSGATGTVFLNSSSGDYEYRPDDALVEAAISDVIDDFVFTATDSAMETTSASFTVTANGVDDAADAANDAFTIDEFTIINGLDLFADNGSGSDVDRDTALLSIAAVNGNTASVGNLITLSSGALLTVMMDGTFVYDTNDAFTYLPSSASGGAITSVTDSFTYTLTDGGTATVSVNVFGRDSDDIFTGSAVDDVLDGEAGNDNIDGLAGNDTLTGGTGNDTLAGSEGDDVIIGGAGDDTFDGGIGTDVADYSLSTEDLVVNINFAGAQNVSAGEGSDTFISVEGINGGSGNDLLVGSASSNEINGGDGEDQIYGIGDADVLNGGAGNDLIEGSGGNDTMDGGAGDADILSYFSSASGVTVNLRFQGLDQAVGGSSGTDLFTGFEDVYGSNAGADVIVGNGAGNTILGFNGADMLFGFSGDDELLGMRGSDTLTGGLGADTLTGGGSTDTFDFNQVDESTSSSRDVIADFGVGGADQIDLSTIDADTSLAGNQSFTFVGSAALSGAGQVRFAQNGTDGFVLADVDGDGNADLNIILLGVTSLSEDDFIL